MEYLLISHAFMAAKQESDPFVLSPGMNWKTHLDETSTLIGLFKLARCSLSTLVVMVAENKNVFRSLGMTLRILSMIGPKSISSNRSASSMTYTCQLDPIMGDCIIVLRRRTRYLSAFREKPFVFSR